VLLYQYLAAVVWGRCALGAGVHARIMHLAQILAGAVGCGAAPPKEKALGDGQDSGGSNPWQQTMRR
jgi:hypothetical protein